MLDAARVPGDRVSAPTRRYDYVSDAAEIYRRSFATIRAEADLSAVPPRRQVVAVRMIHASGDVDLPADLDFHPGLVTPPGARCGPARRSSPTRR